jgi:hypothetical protein
LPNPGHAQRSTRHTDRHQDAENEQEFHVLPSIYDSDSSASACCSSFLRAL